MSLTEGVDTSTAAGKMVFTVLGAVAQLERSLICERVRAGLRNAKAKGKRLGRTRTVVDASKIATVRCRGRFPACRSGQTRYKRENDQAGCQDAAKSSALVLPRVLNALLMFPSGTTDLIVFRVKPGRLQTSVEGPG